jgi:hypothetical protein
MELGVDRAGSDFTSFPLPDGDPGACAAACEADSRCAAWTFTKPGVQAAEAMCWLKNAAPAAVANGCCISGLASAAPPVQQGFYPAPAVNGIPVDWCATFATNCGQGGADQFCQSQGYARASGWTWAYVDQTYVIGSNQVCQVAGSCGALRDVTCAAGQASGGSAISVTNATYGANCGAPAGNATAALGTSCNGSPTCDYRVDHTVIGDPVFGCQKDFQVDWVCGDGIAGHASVPPESSGSTVHLSCPPS